MLCVYARVRVYVCVCVHSVLHNRHKNWTLWVEFKNLSAY